MVARYNDSKYVCIQFDTYGFWIHIDVYSIHTTVKARVLKRANFLLFFDWITYCLFLEVKQMVVIFALEKKKKKWFTDILLLWQF